jgi:pimeloyl-ACP methyl ester carboxylesterase
MTEWGAKAPAGVKVLDSPSALLESLGPVLPVDADSVRLFAVTTAGTGGPHQAQAVVVELGERLAVVAFRGSVDAADWQSNLAAKLVAPVWNRSGPQVYEGYHEAYRKVQFLTRWITRREGTVIVAGHSRGGALAVLLAAHASRLKTRAQVRLMAFGAPPAGEDRLYDGLPAALFVREGDPVPRIAEVLAALPGSRAMRFSRNLMMPGRARRPMLSLLADPVLPKDAPWAEPGAGAGFLQASAQIAGALAGRAESRAAHTIGAYRRGLVDRAWEHAIRTRSDSEIILLARLADLLIER